MYGVYGTDVVDGEVETVLIVAFTSEELARAHADEVGARWEVVTVLAAAPVKATFYVATYDSIRAARLAANPDFPVIHPFGATREVWDYEPEHLEALAYVARPAVSLRNHAFEGGSFWIEAKAGTKREASEALSSAVAEILGEPWTWTAAGGRWT